MPYEIWQVQRAPTWLQDSNGSAWLGGSGATKDDYVALIRAGVLAAFPDYAPPDALGVIGDELGLDRGPADTDQTYAARLKAAWTIWPFAGTPAGLLAALYFAGFPNAVLLTQNGVGYNYSAAPVVADLTQGLVVTPLGATPNALTPYGGATHKIPAGSPWWLSDLNNDFCSRFWILFPGPLPSAFRTWGTAVFTGVEDGGPSTPWPTVVWNNVFPDTSYKVQVGIPTITDGSGPVVCVADGGSQMPGSIVVRASASFSGTVDVLAYQAGVNPFADLHPPDLARLRNVIKKWRPAKATCLGIVAVVQGRVIGWPVRAINASATIGAATTVVYGA